jgi:hypothetical protein
VISCTDDVVLRAVVCIAAALSSGRIAEESDQERLLLKRLVSVPRGIHGVYTASRMK